MRTRISALEEGLTRRGSSVDSTSLYRHSNNSLIMICASVRELVGARTSARTYVALFRVASTRGLTGKRALRSADADDALKLHLLR